MWQRAVLARFARNGHGITGVRAVDVNLSNDGSSLALWGDAGYENDDGHLFDMAAAYFGGRDEPPNMGQSAFEEHGVR